jgi:pyroglutamyl-peptidase
MNILLTGFEPFGGSSFNPSEQVVNSLSGQRVDGLEVTGCILPVDRYQGPQVLLAALRQHQPVAVLCLGEASGRAAISIERVAVNLLDFRIPDNAGNQVTDQPVTPGGPAAYFASLPVREIYEEIKSTGVPVELSLSAGAYLCNQVLYTLLHHLAQVNSEIPAGFIHLPSLPQQAAAAARAVPSMSLETTCAGICTALRVIARQISTL